MFVEPIHEEKEICCVKRKTARVWEVVQVVQML